MRYTLLEMTQRILESMDSDEVNSITDTTESLAVARIIKESYNEIISEIEPKEAENLFHLDASTDPLLPTVMFLPANVSNIKMLKYNVGDTLEDVNLRDLKYVTVSEFFVLLNGLDSSVDWVGTQIVTLDSEDFIIKYRNDVFPHYWTSTDDQTILLDSFDKTVENTVTSARTYGYGSKVQSFTFEDTYVPNLDPRQFSLLLNAAKAQAFVELKQTQNPRAEKIERRHRALAYKTQDNTDTRAPIKRHRGFGRK